MNKRGSPKREKKNMGRRTRASREKVMSTTVRQLRFSYGVANREDELIRLEAASDAAIDDYQRGLEAVFNTGTGRVIRVSGPDGTPWYVEPHDAGDDETTITSSITDADRPASVQYLGYGEPAQEQRAFEATEPEMPVAAPMKLVEPPGALVMRLAAYLPGRRRLRKDLEQVVADMREEHYAALASGDAREAKLALRRGRLACLHAVFPSWAASLVALISRLIGLA